MWLFRKRLSDPRLKIFIRLLQQFLEPLLVGDEEASRLEFFQQLRLSPIIVKKTCLQESRHPMLHGKPDGIPENVLVLVNKCTFVAHCQVASLLASRVCNFQTLFVEHDKILCSQVPIVAVLAEGGSKVRIDSPEPYFLSELGIRPVWLVHWEALASLKLSIFSLILFWFFFLLTWTSLTLSILARPWSNPLWQFLTMLPALAVLGNESNSLLTLGGEVKHSAIGLLFGSACPANHRSQFAIGPWW